MTTNGTPLGYIHDGYTADGFIAESPRLHPSLRFTYRPMLAQNRTVVFREIAKCTDPRKEETLAAQTIKSQVLSWDLVDENGKAVDLTVSNILRVQPRLLSRLFDVVTGTQASDEDPQRSSDENAKQAEDQLAAAFAGKSPEEADTGN